jgi:uroporphyrinogen decarboxylase
MKESSVSRSTRFLDACRCRPVDRVPVWIMRQAGRYLPDYRAVRARVSFLELCETPDLAAEVTLQPVAQIGVDAAIIFSDIMVPAIAMGAEVSFADGPPRLQRALRDREAIDALRIADPDVHCRPVLEAIRVAVAALAGEVPLIGFAAAPWTLATYLVEGGPSRDFRHAKQLALAAPELWDLLVEKIVGTTVAYLAAQVEAGARAIQLFDTWAGALAPTDFCAVALPGVRRIIAELRQRVDVPIIYFPRGAGQVLAEVSTCGADVIGLDWTVKLEDARLRLGERFAVQGNLDPALLFLPPEEIALRAQAILRAADTAPGHIFNLGHGILPTTPPEHARALVAAVHAYQPMAGGAA